MNPLSFFGVNFQPTPTVECCFFSESIFIRDFGPRLTENHSPRTFRPLGAAIDVRADPKLQRSLADFEASIAGLEAVQ